VKKLIRIGIMGATAASRPGYCGLWARMLEIAAHLFYVATLFVPQTRAIRQMPHPLITGFVRAAVHR